MNEHEADETLLLARAHRALSPSAEDANRVRASLQAALATAAGAVPDAAASGIGAAPRLSGWTGRIVVAAAIAGSAGSIGYWAGHRAGVREQPPAPAPVAVSVAEQPPPPPAASPPPSAPEQAARPAPRQVAQTRAAPHREAPAPAATSASLAKEIEALRAVERALRDGRPGLALALLHELDRAVPDGKLVEERQATATIARCASNSIPLGTDPAADFAASYPASVYRDRVEQACAQTDSEGSGDQ
jgi:hypothetical protein